MTLGPFGIGIGIGIVIGTRKYREELAGPERIQRHYGLYRYMLGLKFLDLARIRHFISSQSQHLLNKT